MQVEIAILVLVVSLAEAFWHSNDRAKYKDGHIIRDFPYAGSDEHVFYHKEKSGWWTVGRHTDHKPNEARSSRTGVTGHLMDSLKAAEEAASHFCRLTFKWDLWNCPEESIRYRESSGLTKEIAAIEALRAAAVAHIIAKNCSRGELEECGCGADKEEGDWEWDGCSDNIKYGLKISKNYLKESESTFENDIKEHNRAAGRRILAKMMKRKCKCHGLSGSCVTKSCWRVVPPFEDVSKKIRRKYFNAMPIGSFHRQLSPVEPDEAEEVQEEVEEEKSEEDVEEGAEMKKKGSRTTPNTHPDGVSRAKLVFADLSPDYCAANATAGIVSVGDRMCSRGKKKNHEIGEKGSCNRICRECGYRAVKYVYEKDDNCNCRFEWCCRVKCDPCKKLIKTHKCMPPKDGKPVRPTENDRRNQQLNRPSIEPDAKTEAEVIPRGRSVGREGKVETIPHWSEVMASINLGTTVANNREEKRSTRGKNRRRKQQRRRRRKQRKQKQRSNRRQNADFLLSENRPIRRIPKQT